MRRTVVFLAPIISCLFIIGCWSSPALAQAATATLSGTVEDENGGVVPNATVSITDPAKGLKRQATTNENGFFTFLLLPPSTYSLTVERAGFSVIRLDDIMLNVGDQRALQIQLKVGDVQAAVQVTNEASLLDESPAVSTTVNRQFAENLPLNGRSFQSLVTLTPGVVLTKTDLNEQGQFSVNGQRANANYFTIDGVGANIGVSRAAPQGQLTGGSLPGLGATGGSNNLVSVDALQEFKVLTSTYAPEYGRTPGAQISIVTRPGTNKFSGSLFEYFRNEALDANDWFNNAQNLPKPALRQNDFGGVLGGPIIRDKTFFFFSYEGLRLRLPKTASTLVPSLALRAAAPSTIKPFYDVFPLPDSPTEDVNGFARSTSSFSEPSSLDAISIRIDHTVNQKLSIFGRYNYSPSKADERGGAAPNQALNSITRTQVKTQTFTAGATYILTSVANNEFRFNWSKNTGAGRFFFDDLGGAKVPPDSVFFPAVAPEGDSALIFIPSLDPIAVVVAGKIADNEQRQLNFVDNFSIVESSHALKFGVDYRRLYPVVDPVDYTAQIISTPDLLQLGFALIANISSSTDRMFPVFNNLSVYGQDTWQVNRRLTFTYGLRWEVNPSPKESKGNDPAVVNGLDNPATATLAPFGTPLYKTTYNNFAPRIGAAYNLSERPGRETVLRGGFGIFYDLGSGPASNAFVSFPFVRSRSMFFVPFPLSSADASPPPASLDPPFGSVTAFDPHLKLPRTYQWNLSVEQSLGKEQTITASYVGALGRKLLRTEQLNNPNPDFETINLTRNTATSDYHAMQLQFERRLSRGLQALASYTWAKSIDIASTDSSLNSSFASSDPNADRGPSDFDVRHAFNGAVTYDIPTYQKLGEIGKAVLGHWSVDSIFTARSATPVDLVAAFNGLGVGGATFFSLIRPDY
ncbi:MAG TPA: TonB-dependent receptor, partial [Pyrinomonadaceae bacterium]|nr:TonB-dependent receptor [Pyrinomonadaceae bacterium]